MTALQYSEIHLVTTIYLGLSGVTYKDHQKWKIAEDQTFSAIFILPEFSEIQSLSLQLDSQIAFSVC